MASMKSYRFPLLARTPLEKQVTSQQCRHVSKSEAINISVEILAQTLQ